jgi:hypothetical protein
MVFVPQVRDAVFGTGLYAVHALPSTQKFLNFTQLHDHSWSPAEQIAKRVRGDDFKVG